MEKVAFETDLCGSNVCITRKVEIWKSFFVISRRGGALGISNLIIHITLKTQISFFISKPQTNTLDKSDLIQQLSLPYAPPNLQKNASTTLFPHQRRNLHLPRHPSRGRMPAEKRPRLIRPPNRASRTVQSPRRRRMDLFHGRVRARRA